MARETRQWLWPARKADRPMMLAALIKRSPKRMSLIALAVALAAANASSQAQSSDATIDQVQMQDVWSDMDVHIEHYAWGL